MSVRLMSRLVLLLPLAVMAQSPGCPPQTVTAQIPLPRGTKKVRVDWRVAVSGSTQGNQYFSDGTRAEYTYLAAPSFLEQLSAPGGAGLMSKGFAPTISGYHRYPCDYWHDAEQHCNIPVGVIPPTYDEGSVEIDVASLAATADVELTQVSTATPAQRQVVVYPPGQASYAFTQCVPPGGIPFFVTVEREPSFQFVEMTEPTKMIAHIAAAWDRDNYPFDEQRKSTDTFAGVPLGNRPQFFIRGRVSDMGQRDRVWFRVVDPPDSAPYAAAVAQTGDNVDAAGGTLYTGDGRSAAVGTAIDAGYDPETGVATLILEGSDHVAGDNYQVLASIDPPNADGRLPCEAGNACASTPVITVWKRLYYEEVKMVKTGAFLAENVVGSVSPCSAADPCLIRVRAVASNGIDFIRPGASLTLMGAGGPLGQNSSAGPYFETVNVAADSSTLGPAVQVSSAGGFSVRLTLPECLTSGPAISPARNAC